MTLEAFGAAITNLPIPAIYGPYQNEQAVPYIAYTAIQRNCIYADSIVIYGEDWIDLQLITQKRSLELEAIVENFLTSNGIAFDDPDFYVNDEQHMHNATYSFMLQQSSAATPHISLLYDTASIEEEKTTELQIKQKIPIDAPVVWSSSDHETATVDDGTVTGVKAGTCIIYASIMVDGAVYTDTCIVTVIEKPEE